MASYRLQSSIMNKNAKLLFVIVLIALLATALFAVFKPSKTVTRTNPSYNGKQAKPFKHEPKPTAIVNEPVYTQPKLKTPQSTPVVVLDDVTVTPKATQPTKAPASCPPNTSKGAYHLRGYDDTGAAQCGFTYYNACPYFEAAEAGTPECKKGKPTQQQLERYY